MRPRSHEQEEESRRAFEQALPVAWVKRSQTPDYGLDYKVDVYRNGTLTGWEFAAQLKSCDDLEQSLPSASYVFRTDRLRQYLDSAVPVMLVLYDCGSGRLWFEWIRCIWKELAESDRRKWQQQETATLRFARRLDGKNEEELAAEVRRESLRLGRPLPDAEIVRIQFSGVEEGAVRELSTLLATTEATRAVRIEKSDQIDGSIEADVGAGILRMKATGEAALELPTLAGALGATNGEVSGTLMVAVASLLAHIGLRRAGLDIVARHIEEAAPIGQLGRLLLALPWLSSAFVCEGRSKEALQLAELLGHAGDTFASHMLAIAAHGDGVRLGRAYRRILEARLALEPASVAALHYNIANSFRSDGLNRDALQHYRRAAINDSAYRTRSYWWAEVGGCMFNLNRFSSAERAYRVAKFLDEQRLPVQGLLGDALLRLGRFREARSELEAYLRRDPPVFPVLVLLHLLAVTVNDSFGDEVRRDSKTATAIVARSMVPGEEREAMLQALRADPLCPLAWFNLAVASDLRTPIRSIARVIAAILYPNDVEAWALAASEMPIENEPGATVALVVEAYRRFGGALEAELRRGAGNPADMDKFIEGLRAMERGGRSNFVVSNSIEVRLVQD